MITNTRQAWTAGQTVKVGLLSLVVKGAVATPGDYLPDAYVLANTAGTQLYKFVPHNGLTKLSLIEAQALIAEASEAAARATFRAMTKAANDAIAVADIRTLFAAGAA